MRLTYLRYDTAIKANVEVDREAGTIAYAYDDGPGAFSGAAATRFLDWMIGLVRWPAARVEAAAATAVAPPAAAVVAPPAVVASVHQAVAIPDADVWARPQDLPGAR